MIPVKTPPQDLFQRYNRTYIKYRGKVYYCRVENPRDIDLPDGFVAPDNNVFILYPPNNLNRRALVIDPYSDGVDSSSVKLGYANVEGQAIYVKRPTQRQYRQGVSLATMENALGRGVQSDGANNMLQGIYPTIEEAVERIRRREATSVAFNRHMKVQRAPKATHKFNVFFRGTKIGYLNASRGDFTILLEDEKLSWVISPYLEDVTWRLANV